MKRRLRPVDPDENVEIGTKIEPVNMSLADLPRCKVNKEQFKHWKPWLEEQNLPKWAETLNDKSDLKTVLTKDSKAGEKALYDQAMWW